MHLFKAQEYCYLNLQIEKKKSRKSLKFCFEDYEVHAHQAHAAQAARSAQLNVTSEFRLENKCTYTVWSALSQTKNKIVRPN